MEEELTAGQLGPQHITNYSVIKEKIYLFFMEEAVE